jgi:hypothetical protein
MTALLVLAAISVVVQGKIKVQIDTAWEETPNIYVVIIAGPGERKSNIFELVTAPHEGWEMEQRDEKAIPRKIALDERDVLTKVVTALVKKEVNEATVTVVDDDPDEAVVADEAQQSPLAKARRELEEHRVPVIPRLFASSATPEALGIVMAEQGGRIGILSSEGDAFSLLAGLYGKEAKLELLKKGWSGEPYIEDRVMREGVHIRLPLITIGVCTQPGVLEGLPNAEAFRMQGVFGRILYSLPGSDVGDRLTFPNTPDLDLSAVEQYNALIRTLIGLHPHELRDDGSYIPYELRLTPDAMERLGEFAREVEADLNVDHDGRLCPIPDWGTKCVGQAVRIAALLTLAEHASTKNITGEWMENATRIVRAASTHALRVLTADPSDVLLRKVLSRVQELALELRTVTEVHQRVKGTKELKTVDAVRKILDRLQGLDHLRVREQRSSGGPGRPRSAEVFLHPMYEAGDSDGQPEEPPF